MPYPISASVPSTVPKSRPPLLERRPGTFSRRTARGRTASMMRANSKKSPDLSPASPLRFPATERSWQGKPPQRRSTRPGSPALVCRPPPFAGPPSPPLHTSRTSSVMGTPGHRTARTFRRQGSDSQKNKCWCPARWSPRSSPPTPLKSDPTRTTQQTHSPRRPWLTMYPAASAFAYGE